MMWKLVSRYCLIGLVVVIHLRCDAQYTGANWTVVVHGSPDYNADPITIPPALSLQELTDSIVPSLSTPVPEYYNCSGQGNWIIDTIGFWNEHAVMDLILEVDCPRYTDTSMIYPFKAIKVITIEIAPSRFGLLYVSSTEPTAMSYARSELIQAQEHTILITRSRQTGTGSHYDEASWVWSERFNHPIKLKLKQAHSTVLGELLPPNHGIWKGGRFDIKTLSYQTHTWRDGDANCCPTGGKLSATYAIENDSLVIKEAIFDYSDLEGRALAQAKRSADSMYLKNPPVTFRGD